LIKLLANSSLNSKEINFELVKKTVREVSTNKQVNVSIELITKVVCEHFLIEENKLREKNRRKEIVFARQVAMYLSKVLTKSSLKTIGLHFGGRDHSTVIHSHTIIEELLISDYKIKETIDSIKNKIEMSAS
jgi:chromosomal replication initiator protein